jgi:MFS family permease
MNISPGVILWMSRLLAILSERVRGLVLPWVFLGITAGAAKTSYLASIYQIPSVALAFFLGILAHKIGAKSSYVAATLLSIAVLLFIYMLYLTHGLSFPRLAALSLALGIGECIQRISLNTFIVGLSQAVNLTRYYSMAEVSNFGRVDYCDGHTKRLARRFSTSVPVPGLLCTHPKEQYRLSRRRKAD